MLGILIIIIIIIIITIIIIKIYFPSTVIGVS